MQNNQLQASFSDRVKTLPQYFIPQHALSNLMHGFTRLELGSTTHWLIQRFVNHYQVDMTLAQLEQASDYASFNAFFTRALKSDARPIADATLISPVDAEISQIGEINQQQMLQAKGYHFNIDTLLGNHAQLAKEFANGLFCTLYLSPRDYHRIHMPVTGQLTNMIYVPGRLFSVNQRTARTVPNLFARNERLICVFQTDFGKMALILVGAIFVGSIETVWTGQLTPPYLSHPRFWQYTDGITLEQGSEVGRFNMGSTVIVLLEDRQQLAWLSNLDSQQKVQMGQALAQSD